MRRHGRRDANHTAIVQGLRDRGVRVVDLGSLGNGVPDILAGTPSGNWLLEIKDGRNDLTQEQRAFFATWPGPKAIVRSLDEALAAVGR